ncbi:MAG: hypothetical protein EOM25_02870 [Deltaproteobacteria bacterium]|nr:hypothetical protein [Deltaproteobacteria bacterium]
MSLYIEQIEQLVLLQRLDTEAQELEKSLRDMPEQLAGLKGKFVGLERQMGQVRERINLLEEQKSRIEHEIEEDSAKVKRSKNKLMMVENTKEYHAMMREMDTLEKMNRIREEERVSLLEELAEQNEQAAGLAERIAELRSEIDAQEDGLKADMAAKEKRLAELRKQKAKACECIPDPIMDRFEFIRGRLDNPIVVSVTDAICNGCHIRIPPQIFIEIQKGEQILSCPNCQRIIYWDNHFRASKDGDQDGRPRAAVEEAD